MSERAWHVVRRGGVVPERVLDRAATRDEAEGLAKWYRRNLAGLLAPGARIVVEHVGPGDGRCRAGFTAQQLARSPLALELSAQATDDEDLPED